MPLNVLVILLIISIGITIFFVIQMPFDLARIVVGILGGGFCLYLAIYIIFRVINPKKRKKTKEVVPLIESEPTKQETKHRTIDMIEQSIPLQIYQREDNESHRCGVCKLEIKAGQEICKCEGCLWLFHREHLIKWLVDHEKCPVCSRYFPFFE
ncbi:MAG: hypothetical protein ACTSVH_07465 [Candidatus Heimdallarchaeota archaeon]